LIDVKGALYGATGAGGSCRTYGGCGTVYSISTAGVENVLYAFQGGTDGNSPTAGLIDVNGMLYGTTFEGGQSGPGCSQAFFCGTVYSITTKGVEKVVYRFASGSDGAAPIAALIDVNGVLYGTTAAGGAIGSCFASKGNCGTVYSITTAGVETVLYTFAGGLGGWQPTAPLTNVNGSLYGTTLYGGYHDVCCHSYGWGAVFALSP
jgi:uncharacterized repeat protein (TIGR03803 family)